MIYNQGYETNYNMKFRNFISGIVINENQKTLVYRIFSCQYYMHLVVINIKYIFKKVCWLCFFFENNTAFEN